MRVWQICSCFIQYSYLRRRYNGSCFTRHRIRNKKKNKPNFYSICVWCDIYCTNNIDLGSFPIGSNAYSYTEHLKSQWSFQMLGVVEVLSKQKSEVLPYSVMLTGPHCQSDRAAHQTSAPTLLSRTVGADKRCQIIWQAKWDIFIRSSTPSDRRQSVLGEPFSTPNISYNDQTRMPLLSVALSRNRSPIHFTSRPYRNQPTTKLITSV